MLGKTMKEAHAGMGISDAEFNALVEDLGETLKQFNVPAAGAGGAASARSRRCTTDIVEMK